MLEPDVVKQRINTRFKRILHCTPSGNLKPFVCLVCDEFLHPNYVHTLSVDKLEEAKDILIPSMWNAVPGSIERKYMYMGDIGDSYDEDSRDWIEDMLLSPRECYVRKKFGQRSEGFAVCNSCKMSLGKGMMPRFAIANNFAFGTLPKCLLELTEVELAMVTPVKTYGYCFSYTGGQNKQLKGSLSYYKVEMESIACAAAHFDVLKMHENVVIVLHGKMTVQQKIIARKKNKVRVKKILSAVHWLINNNEEWQKRNIDFEAVKAALRNPVLVDNTSPEDSGENNIETTESFKVFFPDGHVSSLTGGQKNLDVFQNLVKKAKENGLNIDFQCDLGKQAAADFKDNNLVNACLLQFPYGRGGMHEMRKRGDGSLTNKMPIEDYVEHLSKVLQPHFHHELFSLILYNISMKQSMVKSAGYKARDPSWFSAIS